MQKEIFIPCSYCKSQNSANNDICVACGAPLEKPETPKPAAKLKKAMRPAHKEKSPEEVAQKIGEKIEDAYYVYAIGWRSFAEALAIAVAAFIIGVASGATGVGYWGLLGAAAVGIAVGMTSKIFYLALISAPLGAFIGLGIGALFFIFGAAWGLPISVTIFSVIGAILGGRRRANFKFRNWWEKVRPFLGVIGGLIFGFLGILVGLGIEKAISLF